MTYFAARPNSVRKIGKWEYSGYFGNYCRQLPENLSIKTTRSVNESKCVLKVNVIFDLYCTRLCMFCAYTRLRYQVNVYMIIGPLG